MALGSASSVYTSHLVPERTNGSRTSLWQRGQIFQSSPFNEGLDVWVAYEEDYHTWDRGVVGQFY